MSIFKKEAIINLLLFSSPLIAIVIVILTITLPTRFSEMRLQKTRANLEIICQALKKFKDDNDFYPTTKQGLIVLINKPEIGKFASKWNGPYLSSKRKGEEIFIDSWGQPYIYSSDGKSFILKSYGSDGKPGGECFSKDIIISSHEKLSK